jgi:hypothetical protein
MKNSEVKEDETDRACSTHVGKKGKTHKIFVRKPEGKCPLERTRHK